MTPLALALLLVVLLLGPAIGWLLLDAAVAAACRWRRSRRQ